MFLSNKQHKCDIITKTTHTRTHKVIPTLGNIELDIVRVQYAMLLQLDTPPQPFSDDRPALMISSTSSRLLAMTVLKHTTTFNFYY